ncbi:MerR family transcriptional regulator [Planctomycetota bacterium]|nr:MerR family transcriptional regulator [Planctomycetota bacterium]
MFSIGEFSKITGLSVKTIRFYHEKELLIPVMVDAGSGYRYYDHANVETAYVIKTLRDLEFPIDQIKLVLQECDNTEGSILTQLQERKNAVKAKIQSQKNVLKAIDQVIAFEKENRKVSQNTTYHIEERELPAMLIGGIRMTGRYSDMGKAFGQLGRKLNRHINGNAMCLYHDGEYKEDDADFEPFFPIKKVVKVDGISVRELPACRVICLRHLGPYERLGVTYEKLFEYVNEKKLKLITPSREVYLKGPGMIFKGNPEKYITEIQLMVESE